MPDILIVDDDLEWANVLSEHCEVRGYAAEIALTYESALEKLTSMTFYAVIVDLRLTRSDRSDTSGLTLVRTMTDSKLDMPNWIVLTGYPTVEHSREAFKDLRVWDFLTKSNLDFNMLFETIQRAVEDAIHRVHPQVRRLQTVWEMIVARFGVSHSDDLNEHVWELCRFFCQALEIPTSISHDSLLVRNQIYSFAIDTSELFAEMPALQQMPLMFLARREVLSSDSDDLLYCMHTHIPRATNFAVLVLFSPGERLPVDRARIDRYMRQIYARDVVILSYVDLVRLLTTRNVRQAFRQLVLSQIDLSAVSPFVVTGPTPDTMFFGRERELRQISEQAAAVSWITIGGRRIGKSSFLGRLHRSSLPSAGFYTIYHDCSTTPSKDSFNNAVIRDWRPAPPPYAPRTMGELLQLQPIQRPLVLLLDEVDKLVPTDQAAGWSLFNALRALINSGYAQIVLCGERMLRDALRDPASPLFNLGNEMLLGPLDYRAVEELVIRPMKQLEVELVDGKAIVDQIWTSTSGHPNIVQRLCRRLMERLNEQATRRIDLHDVKAIVEDPAFQRDDFLSTYWEAATSLEKIVSLLMADNEDVHTLRAVRQALAERCNLQPKAREVDDALQCLVDLRSILKRTSTGYEFAVEAFPRVVAGTLTLDDMLEILIEEYQEQGE